MTRCLSLRLLLSSVGRALAIPWMSSNIVNVLRICYGLLHVSFLAREVVSVVSDVSVEVTGHGIRMLFDFVGTARTVTCSYDPTRHFLS